MAHGGGSGLGNGESCLNMTAKCLLSGDVAAADKWLDAMENASKTASSKVFYHSLIHKCAQVGKPEAAGWCVERMLRRNFKANAVTFNSVIDACARVGNVALATKWWDEMNKAGLKPNGITYNTMIKACAKAHDPAKAEWWVQRMQEDGFLPCIVSFSTVVDALAKTGDVEKAEAWFRRMQASGVHADAVIFNTLINACAKALNPEKAEKWLLRLQAHGLQADEKTYNSLLNAFAKVGDLARAEHWFEQMERSGCKADKMIFGSLVHASAKAGNSERAEYWIEEMTRRGMEPNLFCLNTILQACAQNHDHMKAAKWFVYLLVAGEADEVSYNSMVDVFAGSGDLATAERWLQKMVSEGLNPNQLTYATMVRACGHATGYDPAQWAYGAIIRAHCKNGSLVPMRQWLGKMLGAGVSPPSSLFEDCIRIVCGEGQAALVPEIQKMAHASRVAELSGGQRRGPLRAAGGGKHGAQHKNKGPAQVGPPAAGLLSPPWGADPPLAAPAMKAAVPQRSRLGRECGTLDACMALSNLSTAPSTPAPTQDLPAYVPSPHAAAVPYSRLFAMKGAPEACFSTHMPGSVYPVEQQGNLHIERMSL